MRILVVSPQPFFTPRGTPFSVYHRTRVTARLVDDDIDLLTYGEGEDPVLPGVRIIRIWRMPFLGPVKVGPSFGKLIRDIFMVLWTVVLLVRRRPGVVHAHEEAVFWCRTLKPVFGFRLIYDMHSSLPQQLENFEFTRSRVLIGIFRWLEDAALQAAEAVITISPELSRYAREVMDDPSKELLIENSLLDEVVLEGRSAGPEAEVDPDLPSNRPLVVYAGTFEAYQGIPLLIRGFARAREVHPDAHLVLVGGDARQVERYRSLSVAEGLDAACTFTGRVPHAVARRILKRASVLTSPRTTGNNTPLKVYELLASGIPFVATRISSHTQVLDPSVCFLADPEPDAFGEAMARALNGGAEGEKRVRAAKALYEDRYSEKAYEAKLKKVLGRAGAVPTWVRDR